MSRAIKSLCLCVMALCMAVQAHAQMAVFDASNFSRNVITAKYNVLMTLKQIQQYCLQLQQYEQQIQQSTNMVKNTVAPIAYVWDQALVTMNDVLNTIDVVDRYKQQAGGLQAYLNQYEDVNYYRGSPCFGPNGCTQQQLDGATERSDCGLTIAKTGKRRPGARDRQTTSPDAPGRYQPGAAPKPGAKRRGPDASTPGG